MQNTSGRTLVDPEQQIADHESQEWSFQFLDSLPSLPVIMPPMATSISSSTTAAQPQSSFISPLPPPRPSAMIQISTPTSKFPLGPAKTAPLTRLRELAADTVVNVCAVVLLINPVRKLGLFFDRISLTSIRFDNNLSSDVMHVPHQRQSAVTWLT